MSKKPSKFTEHISEHPALWAVLFIAFAEMLANGMFILVNTVLTNAAALFICFMLIYPAVMLVVCFIYAKRCGIRWYMPFGFIPIVVIEYILIENFRAIVPDILITTGFCMLFGSGVGNIFVDRDMIDRQKKERRDKRLHEDKKYKKILDD